MVFLCQRRIANGLHVLKAEIGSKGQQMTNEEFYKLSLKLFGEDWVYQVFLISDISQRSVRRMAGGTRAVPENLAAILRNIESFRAGAKNE